MLKNQFIFTFILVFSIFCKTTFAQSDKVLDQIIAIVGNTIVLESSVEMQYLQLQAQKLDVDENAKCSILEDQLFQKLLINQAHIDSVTVPDKEVTTELDARINYFISQIGSKEKLEAYFNKSLFKIKSDFRETIQDQLLTRKMQNKITEDIKITPSEVRKFYNGIPKDSLPLINADIEMLQIVKNIPVSDKAKNEVKTQLEEFRKSVLEKGKSFAALATLYSQDPGSAANGGELGYMGRGDFVPEFSAAAFSLKPGEVSRIVETDFGFHIIQCIDRRGEQMNLRHILLKPKTTVADDKKAKFFLDSLKQALKKDTLTFEQAALIFSEDETTRKNGGLTINPANGSSKFEPSQIDPATNAAIKNLTTGDVSEIFKTLNDKGKEVYKIIKIKNKTKAHNANLKDDYQLIQDMALDKKKKDNINQWITQKQAASYIKVKDEYKNCKFMVKGWIK